MSDRPKLLFVTGCDPDAAYRIRIEASALKKKYDIRLQGINGIGISGFDKLVGEKGYDVHREFID